MDGRNPYAYQDLDLGDSIRLIELRSSSSLKDTIQCRLVQKSLKRARDDIVTPYTALSYVWGDSGHTSIIIVDDTSLRITTSLEAALRHIRDETRLMYIWADGICINQYDNDERAHQVLLMGEIYASAHHTVIYLGSGDPSAGDILRRIADSCDNATYSAAPGDAILIRSLREILGAPWFFRIWILQELVLSREPIIQWGRYRCSWRALSNMAHYLSSAELTAEIFEATRESTGSLPKGSFWLGTDVLQNMQAVRDAHQHAKIEDAQNLAVHLRGNREYFRRLPEQRRARDLMRLVEVMASRAGFGAYDPRDMVYAHLGLAKDANLQVDYTKTIAEVYNNLARETVRRFGSLRILGYLTDADLDQRGIMKCGTGEFTEDKLASWAPNWTSPQKNLPYSIMEYVGLDFDVSGQPRDAPCSFLNHCAALLFEFARIAGVLSDIGPVLEDIEVLPSIDMPQDQSWNDKQQSSWLTDIPGLTNSAAQMIWNDHFDLPGVYDYVPGQPPRCMMDHFMKRRFETSIRSIIDAVGLPSLTAMVFAWSQDAPGMATVSALFQAARCYSW
ncbi:HET-domain-containing protein [Mollisia scopiformis]|uniref:HET-domain-containing protein n=1 Tax=Mollisia scopiformis TaxID=149040 RepID=A0A132B638_MOLSC|nr:HET-domain-containing protein [Mollisia scopiformis]KUJ07878.1 HET-domain-containing protein [Mollisia scopiformis]